MARRTLRYLNCGRGTILSNRYCLVRTARKTGLAGKVEASGSAKIQHKVPRLRSLIRDADEGASLGMTVCLTFFSPKNANKLFPLSV